MKFYEDEWLTLYGGDCRTVLATLPADSVDCVVTSPPYWGLRDYGHEGQLGLERTPEEYVGNMVAVFREVRRVLKPSGTCWLNLGDSYASSPPGNKDYAASMARSSGLAGAKSPRYQQTLLSGHATKRNTVVGDLKPKDLVGIPWRVAFALHADGWYLRSDIIWSKPNPMPESVTDRPTKSHEYLFLLTKSARYHYDAMAIAEPSITEQWSFGNNGPSGELVIPGQGYAQHRPGRKSKKRGEFSGKTEALPGRNAFRAVTVTRNARSVWTIATRPYPGAHFAVFPPELPERCIKAGSPAGGLVLDPFGGSGTVGMVANRLSRRAILIDLNPEYLEQQMRRNAQAPLGLEVSA